MNALSFPEGVNEGAGLGAVDGYMKTIIIKEHNLTPFKTIN